MPRRAKRLIDKLRLWTLPELELLLSLVEGRAGLTGGFVFRRTGVGWAVRGSAAGEREHTVSFDLAACSCEDFRFRNRACKHAKCLRRLFNGEAEAP